MLKLKKIVKDYVAGDSIVHALKGIDLQFRKNEFVSILGQSGCGKTTLLNIVGGLDRYTSGDLIINDKSTKDFKDHDWDMYRNNTIGFVFQTYNLIPHQSVLGNVELALTLSGVSKKERKERAIKALTEVGLSDQIHKRPNQLSGGQMQRVAIARALVNNPHIILADEPTGALDTETSLQVMEILKEISKNRLIIMVTHNPDLAQKYSTRIIRLLDGNLISDSKPYEAEDIVKARQDGYLEIQKHAYPRKEQYKTITKSESLKKKKISMSFFTAMALSFRNLFTKKTRTILTSFAGSIGIIGIALILSLSSGFQAYISTIERDTLSAYPLTITRSNTDITSILTSMRNQQSNIPSYPDEEEIGSNDMLYKIVSSLVTAAHENDLKALKTYIEDPLNKAEIEKYTSAIQYVYKVDLNIYKYDTPQLLHPRNWDAVQNPMLKQFLTNSTTRMMLNQISTWEELITGQELLEKQYDLLKGKWPTSPHEVIVLVDEYNNINDLSLYELGLKDINELEAALLGQKNSNYKVSFDDILNTKFRLVYNSDYYEEVNPLYYQNISDNPQKVNQLLDTKAVDLEICGILRVKEGISGTAIGGTIGYSHLLTQEIINYIDNSEVLAVQNANPTINILQDGALGFSGDNTLDNNKSEIGAADLAFPNSIKLFPSSFEAKEHIEDFITNYNSKQTSEKDEIRYTDTVGLMMSSISTIINAITYVLIAFVSISLVVSSIMIGIITYISVLERTKEIGVLRSIGASKKDISRVFNAETLIVGFVAGALGIIVTVILNFPINIIIDKLAGIGAVAALPLYGAIALILISMLLTLIAGLIPSRLAAKKDPVVALRTE